MIVRPPPGHVRRPGPADVVHELSLQGKRALLEILVVVRRHLGDIARPLLGVEVVDHKGGAPPDPPEPPRLRRHLEVVDAHPEAAGRLGPGF